MRIEFRNQLNTVLIFSILVLLLLTLVRINNVLVLADWQDIGQSSMFLDDFLFKGFRFDVKLVASILIAFVWLPTALLKNVLQSME